MRDYGRVHTSFWSSADMRAMSDDGRFLSIYLLTSPHTTIVGVFRLPNGYVCEDLQWSSERVAKGFEELFANGFATRCNSTKWVWIRKFLEWNLPANPNQWKAARKLVSQIPRNCTWRTDFIAIFSVASGDKASPDTNGCETVSKGFRNQEQEQDISIPVGNETKSKPKKPKPNGIDPDLEQQILAAYHEVLPDLPQIRDWNDRRKRKLRARIHDRVKAGKPADSVAYWQDLFRKAAASDFLTGRRTDWRCPGLEWLLEPKNFTKLIEGAYDNTRHGHG